MKLKLKRCVTDDDFVSVGIVVNIDNIRNGRYDFVDTTSEEWYRITTPTNSDLSVRKKWFITVKE